MTVAFNSSKQHHSQQMTRFSNGGLSSRRRSVGGKWHGSAVFRAVLAMAACLLVTLFLLSESIIRSAGIHQSEGKWDAKGLVDMGMKSLVNVADQKSLGRRAPATVERIEMKESALLSPPVKSDRPDTVLSSPQELRLQTTGGTARSDSVEDVDNGRNATIAYAISLIKCGDHQSTPGGMTDAAIVLRHSIHQTSLRNPASGSKYDYKMYAIVHEQAVPCSQVLSDVGFEVVVVPPPVLQEDIKGEHLRKYVHKEWCCGHHEFIKLFAYTLPEPIVVHLDVDFVFVKPMDDLYDAMLYDKDSEVGKAARARIPVERPDDPWPDRIDAFMTRDWPQVMPGRKPGYQAGFIVIRRDPAVKDEIVNIIKEGDYVPGFQRENGWGGGGYGGFVGAMAMQGLLAYYYDVVRPNTWMELNQCRWNHMGMDVLYRSQPAFRPRHPKAGKCRNDRETCEDCMHTELEKIYNIHYTQCRKPWNCIGTGSFSSTSKKSIPEDSVHLDHCMELLTVWHSHRTDLESKLLALTGDETIADGQKGDYKKDVFQGHCTDDGQSNYLSLTGESETLRRIPDLYIRSES